MSFTSAPIAGDQLRRFVHARLAGAQSPRVSLGRVGITVVDGGGVILYGEVHSEAEHRAAVSIARRTPGVDSVQDQLRVRIRPAGGRRGPTLKAGTTVPGRSDVGTTELPASADYRAEPPTTLLPVPSVRQLCALRVADLMTVPAIAISRSADVTHILERLKQQHLSALPVVDEHGRVLGVVSEADVLNFLLELHRGPRPRSVPQSNGTEGTSRITRSAEELMSAPAISISPTSPVLVAGRVAAHHGVRQLLVVDGIGRLMGVVSRSDLISILSRADTWISDRIVKELAAEDPGLAAGAPCIQVRQGTVTIRGEVANRCDRGRLLDVIADVPGVIEVIDEMSVDAEPAVPAPLGRQPRGGRPT